MLFIYPRQAQSIRVTLARGVCFAEAIINRRSGVDIQLESVSWRLQSGDAILRGGIYTYNEMLWLRSVKGFGRFRKNAR